MDLLYALSRSFGVGRGLYHLPDPKNPIFRDGDCANTADVIAQVSPSLLFRPVLFDL